MIDFSDGNQELEGYECRKEIERKSIEVTYETMRDLENNKISPQTAMLILKTINDVTLGVIPRDSSDLITQAYGQAQMASARFSSNERAFAKEYEIKFKAG